MSNTNIRFRALAPGETGTIAAVFDGMSVESRYRRFHAPIRRLSDRSLAYLAAAGPDHIVVVAEALAGQRWEPIGLAHAVRTDGTEAEVAVEVVDAWQGKGIGRRLLERLHELAPTAGISTFVAHVLAENRPMRQLWADLFPDSHAVASAGGRTFRAFLEPSLPARRVRPRHEQRPPNAPRGTARRPQMSLSTTQGGEG